MSAFATIRDASERAGRKRFAFFLLGVQIVIIILFGLFSRYKDDYRLYADNTMLPPGYVETTQQMGNDYTSFQNIQLAVFVGFGVLATQLRRYRYAGLGYTLLIAAICIQWGMFAHEIALRRLNGVLMSVESLIVGDFAALAVLISFGVLMGKVSPTQMLFMAIVECVLFSANKYIGQMLFKATDVGHSMYTHMFGCYFGMAVSRMLNQRYFGGHPQLKRLYNSDIVAAIGTLVVFVSFPSLNAAMASPALEQRCVVNTIMAMMTAAVGAFVASTLFDRRDTFEWTHIQSAVLAGGVAVGCTANMLMTVYGAAIVGVGAAALCVFGMQHISPCLEKRVGVHDTRGVHNIHGMPALVSAVIAIILSACADRNTYGNTLYQVFPAMVPPMNVSSGDVWLLTEVKSGRLQFGDGRSAAGQAAMQAAAFGVTLAIALVGGAITGLLLRIGGCGVETAEWVFEDGAHFDIGDVDGMPQFAAYIPPIDEEEHNDEKEQVELKLKETEVEPTENGKATEAPSGENGNADKEDA